MKEVVIATKNKGKAEEFQHLFSQFGYVVKTLNDIENAPDIEETGETFAENAILKAESIAKLFNRMVIADDSGLEIDALDGKPGVFSARYAGEEKNDEANIQKVLEELKDVPESRRTARFHCVLAVKIPNEETKIFHGTCEGKILREKRGTNGFGYDPIFFVEEKGKTMAEMSPEEKNQISHRANAIKRLQEWLLNHLEKVNEGK